MNTYTQQQPDYMLHLNGIKEHSTTSLRSCHGGISMSRMNIHVIQEYACHRNIHVTYEYEHICSNSRVTYCIKEMKCSLAPRVRHVTCHVTCHVTYKHPCHTCIYMQQQPDHLLHSRALPTSPLASAPHSPAVITRHTHVPVERMSATLAQVCVMAHRNESCQIE